MKERSLDIPQSSGRDHFLENPTVRGRCFLSRRTLELSLSHPSLVTGCTKKGLIAKAQTSSPGHLRVYLLTDIFSFAFVEHSLEHSLPLLVPLEPRFLGTWDSQNTHEAHALTLSLTRLIMSLA
jgi:hypothetical protein